MGKAVFRDPMADLVEILKPLTSAERNLKECRRRLDSRGIALITRGMAELTHTSRLTLSGIERIHEKLEEMKAENEAAREHSALQARLVKDVILNQVNCWYQFIVESRQAETRRVENRQLEENTGQSHANHRHRYQF